MGQEITYCSKCQTQLRSVDFEKNRAVRVDGVSYCAACAKPPPAMPTSTPRSGTERSMPAVVRPVAKGGPNSTLAIGGVIAAVVLLLGVGITMSGNRPQPRVPEPTGSTPMVVDVPRPKATIPVEKPPEIPVAPVRKPETAKESLRKAREFAQANPADFEGQIAVYDQAAWDARETEFLEAARAEREAIVKRQRQAFAAEAKEIESLLRPRLDREEFGGVIAAWQQSRGLRASPEWTALVDKNIADIRARAETLLASLMGAKDLKVRVAKWGLPDLEKTIVETPEPPKTPEAETVQKGWRAAMDLAAGRDYAATIKELERLRQETTTPALKAELTGDVEALKELAAAVDEQLKSFSRLTKGQKVLILIMGESGAPQKIEGTVARLEPHRLVLKTGEDLVVVPLGDVLAATLAEMIPARGARAAYLLCCVEGDVEAAKKRPVDAVPAKYGELATTMAQKVADPAFLKREADARKQFAVLEAELAVPATAAGAVEKIGPFLKELGDTLFARRNAALIRSRLDAGKDFVFFADQMASGGTFKPGRSAKTGTCLISDADSPATARKDNFVDLDFTPLPSTEYRCWVYVGACCGEVFEFFYQATELAGAEVPAKPSISTASRKHSAHGGPKTAAKWGWVSLPLPKFAQPGLKKVRVLTDQQGFSVGFGVVSSTRTTAPTEAEMKDWVREAPRLALDPSLVAYWTCDGGATLQDLTRNGNHGVLKNNPSYAAGKVGKALEFDGTGAHVRVPTSPSFDAITKQVTLAAWVYRKGAASDVKVILGRQQGGGSEDQWMLGFLNNGVIFTIGPNKRVDTIGLPMEQWTHVAATFNGTAMLVYVNGAEVSGTTLPLTDLAVESKPVTIGGSINGGDVVNEYFQGLIDEVRVYSRALTAAEIAALAKTGKP